MSTVWTLLGLAAGFGALYLLNQWLMYGALR